MDAGGSGEGLRGVNHAKKGDTGSTQVQGPREEVTPLLLPVCWNITKVMYSFAPGAVSLSLQPIYLWM